MPYQIDIQADAWDDLRAFRKGEQVKILKAIEDYLTYEPTKESKSRIKQLREDTRPDYRLRVDDFRVYYDVWLDSQKVVVYGIVHKDQSQAWLAAFMQRSSEEEEL